MLGIHISNKYKDMYILFSDYTTQVFFNIKEWVQQLRQIIYKSNIFTIFTTTKFESYYIDRS